MAILSPTPDERRQFGLLFRAFVRRLFENDLVPETVDLRQSVLSLAAIFIVPPLTILYDALDQKAHREHRQRRNTDPVPHK